MWSGQKTRTGRARARPEQYRETLSGPEMGDSGPNTWVGHGCTECEHGSMASPDDPHGHGHSHGVSVRAGARHTGRLWAVVAILTITIIAIGVAIWGVK